MSNPKSKGDEILEKLDGLKDEIADKVKEKLKEEAEELGEEVISHWKRIRSYLSKNNTAENIVIVVFTIIVVELLHEATGRKLLLPMIKAIVTGG